MPQCKARTASGKQCASPVAAPSRTLCKRHQNQLAAGSTVINFGTGKPIPARAAARIATADVTGHARTTISTPTAQADRVPTSAPQYTRTSGEHPLHCDVARCGQLALAGTNYCMKHQGLA